MGDTKTLFENKKEYLQHLQDILVDPFLNEFQTLYDTTMKSSASGKVLQEFQHNVSKIAEWNHVMIESLYERVHEHSKCDFLNELIRAIFVTYVRFNLASHGKLDRINQVKIRVPNAVNFVHRCLIACARTVWRQPYLFYHAVRSIERQHNRAQADEAFRKAIASTVRNAVPWDQLLSITVTHEENIEEHYQSDDGTNNNSSEEEQEEELTTESSVSSSSEDESDVEVEHVEEDDVSAEEDDDSAVEDGDGNEEEDEDDVEDGHNKEEEDAEDDSESQDDDDDVVEVIQEVVEDEEEDDDLNELVQLTEDDIPLITADANAEQLEDTEGDTQDAEGSDDAHEDVVATEDEEEDKDAKTIFIEPRKLHKPRIAPKSRVTDGFF